jgi:hypothetical protein
MAEQHDQRCAEHDTHTIRPPLMMWFSKECWRAMLQESCNEGQQINEARSK